MIIRTQNTNQLIDMAGCVVQKANLPMPAILLIPVIDLKNAGHGGEATRVSSLLLYSGTQAEVDKRFDQFIDAAVAMDIYFSMAD